MSESHDANVAMVILYLCSHDKALLSRRQAYVVAPPSGEGKPKDGDKTKGDGDKPKGDDDKAQDDTVITPSVTSNN